MKTLYLDVFSGISGDMFLGAMLDLGVDVKRLEVELAKLRVPGYHLHATRKRNTSIEGVKFDVHIEGDDHDHPHGHAPEPDHTHNHNPNPNPHDEHEHEHQHAHGHSHSHAHGGADHHGHSHPDDHDHAQDHGHEHVPGHSHSHEHEHEHGRSFADIQQLIQRSSLSDWVKTKALAVFQRVAVAEGKIHGQPPAQVHFHEVGAIDSIVDIVGACIALELLGKPRVLAAPVVDGTGWVDCAHGRFPVPTTATLEILGARGIALTQCEEPHELVTPTGAALLAEFAESFGPMQGLVASKVGYGLGTRQNKTRPNVLRAVLGESAAVTVAAPPSHDWDMDTITVLETNIDDCSGELLGYCFEQAFAAGALDVFLTPIHMKKSRPGVVLTILCAPADADRFSEMLLRQTSAFGVRRYNAERRKLHRESVEVQTPFGAVSVKLGRLDGKIIHAAPEFESCKQAAARTQASLRAVYEAAERAGHDLEPTV